MLRRRPVPSRNAGAVACLAAVGAVVAGCGGSDAVPVDAPAVSGADAPACQRLLDALPGSVADQPQRPVTPEDAYAAAWGDPAIVLRCGVGVPAGFDEFASCNETNGVGWFVPEDQVVDGTEHLVMSTIGFAQTVEVTLPAEYFPPATAMVDLANAIKGSIREVKPCV